MLQELLLQALETAQRELINELRQGNSVQVFENFLNW
jgi:hypothetical protein